MVQTTTRSGSVSRGFAALMLLTAGALVLAGQVWSIAGDALMLVLGIELIAWARVARDDTPLVFGGVVTGIGGGIVLAAGPLLGAHPNVVGGAFLACLAAGFAVIALLSRWWLAQRQRWAWITAGAVATVGVALIAGESVLSDVMSWGLPVALLAGGVAAAVGWLRGARR